jgi:hypothetical protein
MTPRSLFDCEGFHRRDFLKIGTAGLLGLGLPDLLRLEARCDSSTKNKRKARGVILVWLAGGPATIDMWDLKPDAPDGIRGEFKPIDTNVPGVHIGEHLPKMARVMDRCLLVRSLQHSIAAHGPGTVYLTTGNRPTPALDYPSLGSLAAKVLTAPVGVPSYVTFSELKKEGFPGGAGYLGAAYNPFEVEGNAQSGQFQARGVSLPVGFTLTNLEDRTRLRDTFDATFQALDEVDAASSLSRFQQQALDILRSDKTRKAFDLDQETPELRDKFGRHPLGQSALAARRLIEAGARFVTIGMGGWDTHGANFASLRNRLLPPLDQALAALIEDLDARGLLDSTIVYCAGEFGRTPRVNGTAGRDHWARSMAVLLAGGGFCKGMVYGGTDGEGMVPASDPCSPDDVSATIFAGLGIDPRHELQTTSGRPIALFREGKVLSSILG